MIIYIVFIYNFFEVISF